MYYYDQDEIKWVNGIEGANAYRVMPNRSVLLMDQNEHVFYIKTADASGMPLPIRTFDYEERVSTPTQAQNAPNMENYVTKEELAAMLAELQKKPTTRKEKADE